MTLEQIVIGLIRIAGSLPVLRWTLAGAIVAILVDFSDLFWMGFLDLGGLGNYQAFDKWIDIVYMLAFLWVANRWSGIERTVAIGLFGFRMIGFITFELTGARPILLAFPNIFEFASIKGLFELTAASPLAVIVPGVTVLPVVVEVLQHNNFTLLAVAP